MYLSLDAPFVCAGENLSRLLKIHTGGTEANGNVRIAFRTPGGKTFVTRELTETELSGGYELPCAVLDRYGRLSAQLIVTGENGYCIKSDIYDFEVSAEIAENACQPENSGLISLAGVDNRLLSVEERLAGLTAISGSELAQILI